MQIPLNELLTAVSTALDFVEQELLGVTSNHGKRAAYISARICRAMGMTDTDIFDMAGCAILHDSALTAYMLQVGPGRIGRLEQFQEHCTLGEKNAAAFPFAGDTSGIILQHHENWDGTGFHGIAGEDIPLRARVLRLADSMDLGLRMGDARAGLETEIHKHVRKYRGRLYAPAVAEVLLDLVNQDFISDMSDTHIDVSLRNAVPDLDVELQTKQMLEVCSLFAVIIDAKSSFTRMHSTGIADKAGQLAMHFGLDDESCDQIRVAAYLHDVGKLSTPLTVLEKPGRLTDAECAVMREHAALTEEILTGISGFEDIARWAWSHHERLNGTGYPHGCNAGELPFESRLVACCDIYQALTEDRPYRAGMSHDAAVSILKEMADRGEVDQYIVASINDVFERNGANNQ